MRKILNIFSLLFHASTYRKLKDKWEIKSNFQLIIILIVFAITGSTSAAISGPTIDFLFGEIEMNGFLKFIQELESQGIFKDKIVTEVNDIQKFFVAEDYHHDYFSKNPENAYCQAVINPKLNKLRSSFSELISE